MNVTAQSSSILNQTQNLFYANQLANADRPIPMQSNIMP